MLLYLQTLCDAWRVLSSLQLGILCDWSDRGENHQDFWTQIHVINVEHQLETYLITESSLSVLLRVGISEPTSHPESDEHVLNLAFLVLDATVSWSLDEWIFNIMVSHTDGQLHKTHCARLTVVGAWFLLRSNQTLVWELHKCCLSSADHCSNTEEWQVRCPTLNLENKEITL